MASGKPHVLPKSNLSNGENLFYILDSIITTQSQARINTKLNRELRWCSNSGGNLQFRKAIPSMMRVKKSSNGWANLMVRATELSIPANRKTLRLVSLFVIHVKAQSKWKESQKLLKTRRLKNGPIYFSKNSKNYSSDDMWLQKML
ncbi:hypothetical protein YC2023_096360 [Brassica napus]